MARRWILKDRIGFEEALQYETGLDIPSASSLGPNEVLVKLQAASLNYRELMIPDPNSFNGPIKAGVVPGCDGAGIVLAIGSSVTEFKSGDKVVTYMAEYTVEKGGDEAQLTIPDTLFAMGHGTDGTLRTHAVLSEKALVHSPKGLDLLPASTLTCTWLTAWNGFRGLKGQEADSDSWILVQGTGGVSIAMLQLAVALGSNVVATTSTKEKAERLKSLGAKAVINYRETENWGEEARKLTPGGQGFDFVVDVGGNETMNQSLKAVRTDGQVLLVGGVGGDAPPVPLFATLLHTCIVRGFLLGSRTQMKEMIKFLEDKGTIPLVDDVVFELKDAKDAYRRFHEKKHFAKIAIKID